MIITRDERHPIIAGMVIAAAHRATANRPGCAPEPGRDAATNCRPAALREKGALILLNASTGEILSLASHPGFDPNTLDENWQTLNQDPSAPFVNRVTQGAYPPGRRWDHSF